jgi:hypothetical protein
VEEFKPALERMVVARRGSRAQGSSAHTGFESKAREAQQQPVQTGEQQRRTERWPPETVLILRYKEGVIERKCAVELAVHCTCMSELEEENINLEDTLWGLWEMPERAMKEGQYRQVHLVQRGMREHKVGHTSVRPTPVICDV